jgi:glycerol uptake facilitator-like aquaporin
MGTADVLEKLHFNQGKSSVLVEFVGTFLLVLTVSLASWNEPEMAPLAAGFMLMALVFAFGYISGGHFNPAVTLAAYFCERDDGIPNFPWYNAIMYAVAQLAGSAAAGVYLLFILGFNFPTPNTPNNPLAVFRGFIAESVYTFVLASVVMHVAMSSQRHNEFYGFAIGMAVMSAALCVGGVSGGAFNPAVATGLIVVNCVVGQNCHAMIHLWMYWAAEIVGAIVATILFNSVTVALADSKLKSPRKMEDSQPMATKQPRLPAGNNSAELDNGDGTIERPLDGSVNGARGLNSNSSTNIAKPQAAANPIVMRPMPTAAHPNPQPVERPPVAAMEPKTIRTPPASPRPSENSGHASPPAQAPLAASPSAKMPSDVDPLDPDDDAK